MIVLNIDDEMYPQKLKDIPNSPKKLYLEGNLELLNSCSIAIIGSRKCSENGKNLTKQFASSLSSCGITVVSGLARGIDSIAHSYSFEKKGRTIAVLGCGMNKIYPPENINLYNKIIENGGLVISEYSPNVEAQSSFFLKRNRIITGLSLGVLVIEAKYRSGTSVTAKIAKKQNRTVFALPHEIWDPCGVGTNKLLKEGAKLVTSPMDILDYLKLNKYMESFTIQSKGNICSSSSKLEKNNNLPSFSDKNQAIIFQIIKKEKFPISINELVVKSQLPINIVISSLFMLEIQEFVKKVEHGYIVP